MSIAPKERRMGSCSPQLPLICLSDQTLKPGSSNWVKVRSDVRKALEEYGCFEAQCDQLSMELRESFLESMKDIFALPTEIKQRNVCPKPFMGYLIHNDLNESLGIPNANVLEKALDFTRQIWPESEGNKSIGKKIQLFSEILAELDAMVRRMVMESYGLEKYIDEHLNSTYYRLRVMKYIAQPDNDDGDVNVSDDGAGVGAKDGINVDVGDVVNDNVSADVDAETNVNGDADAETNGDATAYAIGGVNGDNSAGVKDVSNGVKAANVDAEKAKLGIPGHTDKSLTGIIYQYDQIDGLEVKNKEGKWIRVSPATDSVIFIAGDALCALTNGRIPAPYHRVRVTEKNKTRYSTALFSNPKAGYLIDSPKELVDEKHPRLFKPFDFVDLFNFFNTEAGRRAQSPLHAFCAISGE